MSHRLVVSACPRRFHGLSGRLWRCTGGATAVEFALVLPVLFVLIFGVIEVSLLFAADVILTNATQRAARLGRTGFAEAKLSQDATIKQFLKSQVGPLMDPDKLVITSKAYSGFGQLAPPEAFDDKNGNGKYDAGEKFTDRNGNGKYDGDLGVAGYGGASQVVSYTVIYPWSFFTPMIGRLMSADGTIKLTATAIVQNEPY